MEKSKARQPGQGATKKSGGATARDSGEVKNFKNFVGFMRERQQKREALAFALAFTVIGVVLHILYPLPFTFPDSGAYVIAAKEKVFNVYRPMGYSTYMSIVHTFGKSATFLFVVSFILNALATMFLLFSAKYLMGLRGWAFHLAGAFSILAPRIIFSTNFIMSDGLFNSLTMLFIATALWMVWGRNLWVLAFHLLCFVALYRARYSGMFYVPISVVAIYLSYRSAGWAGRSLALVPLAVFAVVHSTTKASYVKYTGVDTFAGFSGWQLINNTSVLFPEAKELPAHKFPPDMQALHEFLVSVPDSMYRPEFALISTYMWDNKKQYKQFLMHYLNNAKVPYPLGWVRMGKLYGDYSGELIKEYPGRYLTRFLWPSFVSNFACRDFIEERLIFRGEPLYRDYFGIHDDTYEHNRVFTSIYPVRRASNWIYWLSLAVSAAYFCVTMTRERARRADWQCAALLLLFMLIYTGTAVVAAPNSTWRYTMPVYVPSLVFMAYCVGQAVEGRTRRIRQGSAMDALVQT